MQMPSAYHAAVAPALSPSEPVVVDVSACRRLASFLSSYTIPPAREDSSLADLRPESVGNFYLLLVAICHQTSAHGKPALEGIVAGRHLRGWDYLSGKLEAAVRVDTQLLSPVSWEHVEPTDISGLFRDEVFGERLIDPAGRAALVR